MTVQPGWYTDPVEPSIQRYWDGDGWVGKPIPADATPPPGPPPTEPEPEPEPERIEPGAPTEPQPPTGSPASADQPQPGSPAASSGGWPPPAPGSPAAPANGWPPPAPGSPAAPTAGGVGGPPQWGPVPPQWGAVPPGQLPPGWPHQPYPYGQPTPRPHGMALAPLGARLAARLIDIAAVFLLNVVVNGWFVWRYWQEIAPVYREMERRYPNTSYDNLPEPGPQADALLLTIVLIAIALWFAYEVPALRNSGQTLGKRLTGIKVVALGETAQLSFGRAARRWNILGGWPVLLWCCAFVGFLIQLIDCVFPLFDRPLRQALHDKWAQTVVVQVPRPSAGSPAPRSADRAGTPGGSA